MKKRPDISRIRFQIPREKAVLLSLRHNERSRLVAAKMFGEVALLSIVLSACASPEVPLETLNAAQCMIDALKMTGRAEGLALTRSFQQGGTSAAVGYGFRDPDGDRRYAWLDLFTVRDAEGYYLYSGFQRPIADNDPAKEVDDRWLTECRVKGVLIIE
jgi:hypothetical protein